MSWTFPGIVASTLGLSVHLPRIGAGTPGFNWYGIERVLKKYFGARGVPTYVYYFKRRRPQYHPAQPPPPRYRPPPLTSDSKDNDDDSTNGTDGDPTSSAAIDVDETQPLSTEVVTSADSKEPDPLDSLPMLHDVFSGNGTIYAVPILTCSSPS
jgi:hypothetical protein